MSHVHAEEYVDCIALPHSSSASSRVSNSIAKSTLYNSNTVRELLTSRVCMRAENTAQAAFTHDVTRCSTCRLPLLVQHGRAEQC